MVKVMQRIACVVSLLICSAMHELYSYNVGLLIMATGKYIQYVAPLIASADKFFCRNSQVTYFVFTDGQVPVRDDVIQIYQSRLGWPYDTLMRSTIYYQHWDKLAAMDYLFACDADMLFVDVVGEEILSDRVATQHPGYIGRRGTYETKSESCACVGSHEGKTYFAGGFHGGSASEFYLLIKTMTYAIAQDGKQGIIALWHDESHLNRYYIDHEPTLILTPSYCYPESWNLPYHKRLLALDKNHGAMRSSH